MKRKAVDSSKSSASLKQKRATRSSELSDPELAEVQKGRGSEKRSRNVRVPTREEDEVQEAEFEEDSGVELLEEEDEEQKEAEKATEVAPKKRIGVAAKKNRSRGSGGDDECCFLGKQAPLEEAKLRWPHRYQSQNSLSKKGEDNEVVKAKCHYLQAKIDGCIYNLYDDAFVKADEGEADYIGRIVEFFQGHDKQLHFTAQWFFRAEDTVIKDQAHSHDAKRVFLSNEKDDNVLDCIVSKIKIVRAMPSIDLSSKNDNIPPCDLYYDMSYSTAYSTFANLSPEEGHTGIDTPSSLSEESESNLPKHTSECDSEVSLLDLYSGCGAMSTGLCLGARLAGINLQTRWAVDLNPFACESLKLNHPKTEVRNELAEDFLALLEEWEKLCRDCGLLEENAPLLDIDNSDNEDDLEDPNAVPPDEFEVGKIVGICYGKTENLEKVGLKFKVRWKGYGPSDDTWEPCDGLSKCEERIHDFVKRGYRNNILPLPGRVDVVCGGPPCQGISGFNRFRKVDAPLDDPKNYQLKVYMDIVDFLKPKYVLMENVVDILKFAGGHLGRFALSRLVAMNYQARLGILPAGSFGLPQFRLRAFLWGACQTKKLPQFPLPTHHVVARGCCPTEFESNVVPYKENPFRKLKKALLLEDAISDLPPVTNYEVEDEMQYGGPPKTDFQRFIRQPRTADGEFQESKLFDHRPLQLKEDDYLRTCRIPKEKGANFRNLPGVMVGPDKVVQWDPNVERVYLPSGKPLVPDYAMSFVKGKSSKPFGRLWWDEIIATVVTRAEPHNQALLHPVQDRVLTIRENARIQGFPDYYKLLGPVKERYIQVGNAVAVPIARALGYSLGLAFQGKSGEEPAFDLPAEFPNMGESLDADIVVDS